jgi:hypothetical protein
MKYKTFRGLVTAGGVIAVLFGCGGLAWWCGSGVKKASEERRAELAPSGAANPQAQPTSLTAPPQPTALGARPVEAPGASPTNATQPLPAGASGQGIPLRPMDRELLELAARPISGDKVKDALKGRSYKVNVYKDAGEPRVNRLKVDLDRDDKFDEKWTLSPARDDIRRQVSPADDDSTYTEEYRLRGEVWVRK